MEGLNQVLPRRVREPRVELSSSNPQSHAVSASSPVASSRTFVGSECMFVDVTTSKLSCFRKCKVKGKGT